MGTCTDILAQVFIQEALQDVDRKPDDFIAFLAQELRSPLAPIRTSLGLFKLRRPLPEPMDKAIVVMDGQIHQMSRLIDDLLDVARVTRAKIRFNEEMFDDTTIEKNLKMQKILLIDDNVDFTTTMAGALEYFGNQVIICHEGVKGIEVYKQERPHVVICDIGLPGMTGYDVARSIFAVASEKSSPPRMIALSGYGQQNDKLLAHEAGFARHFTKPVNLDALLDALK